MAEHQVKRKLRQEILPYVVSANLIRKKWFYRLHSLYGYWGDMIAGAAALGIGHPLLQAFVPPDKKAEPVDLRQLFANSSHRLLIIGIIAALLWLAAKTVFTREDGQKRAVLARSCWRSFQQVEISLHNVLVKPDPMPDLNTIVLNRVQPLVDRNHQEGAWPWPGPAPYTDGEVEKYLSSLCAKYEANWNASPEVDLLRKEGK